MADARAERIAVSGAVGPLPLRRIRGAVAHVLRAERRDASIAITFLGARRMRELNAEYKDHDYPTDVISFSLPLPDGSLAGDIYVCRRVAAQQARAHGVSVREELVRLAIHGTLHVLGYDHPEGDERTASEMWRRQERYLEAVA